MTLRFKLMLALLLTNLLSIAVVGGIAYYKLAAKFSESLMQEAFTRFEQDVIAYVQTYGSWVRATESEPFSLFIERYAAFLGKTPQHNMGLGASLQQAPNNTHSVYGSHLPPFRFVLSDPYHLALLAVPPYDVGDQLSHEDIQRARPIYINGQLFGYAVPKGVLTLSQQDKTYLNAMREALMVGVVTALFLALVLGVIFGNRVSLPLRQLAHALRAMGEGKLRQYINTRRQDELGLLAQNFNRMSEDLATSHEALQASHAKIQAQAKQLKELSIRDGLTQLYNRRHFDEYASRLHAEALRYQHPFTVMMGDIDFFKRINDNFSHATGDLVLKQVAQLLQTHTRNSDLVARYGGEEFVIAFSQTSLAQAVGLCERLRAQIEAYPWHTIHPDLKVTMSMGLNDRLEDNLENMLKLADQYLYEAKHQGRNQVRYATVNF
ncbi:GGDEF domain-containing protein [Agitococcus lubricus]|uniref:diguanylate cyclase n=1 Tax=Agitococcus lubricus TaxID=1077255 RepID=A0A2T5J1F9_9GAMM|nr:GGDEF domain-containing protein [Agitococcus lubricus]PTQ90129.1 diguanylate cyclase (GGDEF)-like protein [Agitococcus lubricus]